MKTSKQRGRWKYPKGFLVAETVSLFVMSLNTVRLISNFTRNTDSKSIVFNKNIDQRTELVDLFDSENIILLALEILQILSKTGLEKKDKFISRLVSRF